MPSVTRWLSLAIFALSTQAGRFPPLVLARASNSTALVYDNADWDQAAAQASDFVSQLTLDEKIGIVTGDTLNAQGCVGNVDAIARLGFGGLCMLDGPQALRGVDGVSVFPSGITMGATWDTDLIRQRGVAMAEEFKGKGGHVMLGPVSGPLGRNPLGGRNWEGFAADPYLAGACMSASITGSQSVGVQTSSKHFIGNEQETQRTQTSDNGAIVEAISSNIDDRTLHELYLWPFADAIRAGTSSVMCSYNRLDQEYACANERLLTDILRTEMGFRGYVVSDWYATHSTAETANSGTDIEMPGVSQTEGSAYFGPALLAAVTSGSVAEERLDEMATRVLTPYYLLGQNATDYPTVDPATIYASLLHELGWNSPEIALILPLLGNPEPPAGRDVRGDHGALIRKMGSAGTVLLKNKGNVLPLGDTAMNVGVFGNDAGDPTDGLANELKDPPYGFEYGTLDIGGGSGTGRHATLVSPLSAVKERVARSGGKVQYLLSNPIIAEGAFKMIYPRPDVCLVFLKTFAAETYDRDSFEADWNSTRVVSSVAAFCPNTVVVTHSGGLNTMPWADHENVTAIVAAHLPGEESGNSLVDVLWGDAEPGGRLPYTVPKQAADYDIPVVNLTGEDDVGRYGWQANFTEGLNIDYRHFDALDIEPLYEFGFGLSYTSFELSGPATFTRTPSSHQNETLEPVPDASADVQPGGNPELWSILVRGGTTVMNTGDRAGATVVQLYLSYPEASVPDGTPVRVLRGFRKVFLAPGEEVTVTFDLTRRDLSYWDVDKQTWRIPEGEFGLQVGFSSRDLVQSAVLTLI
ncbi:glycoside hydrolase superfamily [Xylariomycetidae sp. FL2044]|nr:glycoside hydrolase superfamily [Xylariomycetidae sp. FL2044]